MSRIWRKSEMAMGAGHGRIKKAYAQENAYEYLRKVEKGEVVFG